MSKKRSPSFTKGARHNILKKTKSSCCYCNKRLKADESTIEHIWDRWLIKRVFGKKVDFKRQSKNQFFCLASCHECNHSRGPIHPLTFAHKKQSNFIEEIKKILTLDPPVVSSNNKFKHLQANESKRFPKLFSPAPVSSKKQNQRNQIRFSGILTILKGFFYLVFGRSAEAL
jgi:hypothetical protein